MLQLGSGGLHSQVQEAAGVLIRILIAKGDLFDAERYVQVTYGNLRDKKNGMDQEGKEMARGAYNLADVIHRQNGDLKKAEELGRECLHIGILAYGSSQNEVGLGCNLLVRILKAQGNFGDETRGLYERFLALSLRNEGPEGVNTATGHYNVGFFCLELAQKQSTVDSKRTQLQLAKSLFFEAQRIFSKAYGPTDLHNVEASFCLTNILTYLSQT
jgi:hypothetical protein